MPTKHGCDTNMVKKDCERLSEEEDWKDEGQCQRNNREQGILRDRTAVKVLPCSETLGIQAAHPHQTNCDQKF